MKPTLAALILLACMCCTHVAFASLNYDAHGSVHALDDTTSIFLNRPGPAIAQPLKPAPGAKLNYTQIMFEHPQVTGADQYVVQVALNDGSNKFSHLVFNQKDSSTATMASGFEFGKNYIWRYSGLQKGRVIGWQGPFAFEIRMGPTVDKKSFKVNVLQNNAPNTGGLIVLDLCGNIIDRNGNPVWFCPMPPEINTDNTVSGFTVFHNNAMRVTPAGTITSIMNRKAQERDLNGNVIWQAPMRVNNVTDTLKYLSPFAYHHCFKKLASGNYMVIDQDNLAVPDSVVNLRRDGAPFNIIARSTGGSSLVVDETIKEFDATGKLVWSWSSEKYFSNAELSRMLQTRPDSTLLHREPGGHMNVFDVDEQNGFVYAGFRNVSRVIKIDKKNGQVVNAWGDDMRYNGKPNGDRFFMKQHGLTLLHNGNLALFNNNPQPMLKPGERAQSAVVVFTQPADTGCSKIAWRYACDFDSAENMASVGGNVDELKSGNLLVCMGAVNRVFEITPDKKVVWNAVVETFNTIDSTWRKFSLYQAHYTSSLYPCYFSIQTQQAIGAAETQLKVFNDGSEDDDYVVEISGYAGKKQFSTGTVHSKKSVGYNINTYALPARVTVTSKTNPAFIRVVDVR